MGVLDGGGDCQRGRGSFGGEFGASSCNQWDILSQLCESNTLFADYFVEDLLLMIICMLV